MQCGTLPVRIFFCSSLFFFFWKLGPAFFLHKIRNGIHLYSIWDPIHHKPKKACEYLKQDVDCGGGHPGCRRESTSAPSARTSASRRTTWPSISSPSTLTIIQVYARCNKLLLPSPGVVRCTLFYTGLPPTNKPFQFRPFWRLRTGDRWKYKNMAHLLEKSIFWTPYLSEIMAFFQGKCTFKQWETAIFLHKMSAFSVFKHRI